MATYGDVIGAEVYSTAYKSKSRSVNVEVVDVAGWSRNAGGDGTELATAGSGQLILAASSGASWLCRTGDGGRTWATSYTTNNQLGFADLRFVDAQHGFAIDESEPPGIPNTGTLLRTVDAGGHWTRVALPSSA